MIVLLWLLLYPIVATVDTATRAVFTDTDIGRHNAGHAAVYATGTFIMLVLHYV